MTIASAASARQATAASAVASAACILLSAAAAAGIDEPVRASWKAVPLRDWAARVTPLVGMPVIVDRRLDPDTSITLDCRGEPLREALAAAADQAGAEVATLRSSIRIVPRPQRGLCERAEDARDRDLGRLPTAPRAALRKRSGWKWAEAARPRDLVGAVAAEAGVSLEGVDELPHDHFPAADLPEMTRAEKIDLVLAHFDRRAEWRSRAGEVRGVIVPLDADLPPPRRDVAPRPRPSTGNGKSKGPAQDVFELRAAAPLDEILGAVAGRLGLELDLDRTSLEACGIAARQIVRIDVHDASREELLDRIVTPLSLAWRIEADRLRVFAPPAAGPSD